VARPRNRREPRGDQATRARLRGREGQATPPAQVEDDLGEGALVLAEEVAAQVSAERLDDVLRARLRPRLDEEVDVDLEVACADRHVHPPSFAPRAAQRL